MPHDQTPSVLIAPVGTKPQLVTIALDLLHAQGEIVEEAIILHTTLDRQANRVSIAQLGEEFSRFYFDVSLRPICLCDEHGIPLRDIASEPATREAFRVLYREMIFDH